MFPKLLLMSSTETKLKVVCVGAGYFARYHVDAWTRIEKVTLDAICDSDLEKAEKLAAEFGIARVYDDLQELLSQSAPDVVDIITPPDSHFHLVKEIASRGIDIICQKPLAPTYQESAEIVSFAKEKGVRFLVHENFRFQPWYRRIKELLESNTIGDQIHQVSIKLRTGDGWGENAYMGRQPYFRTMPRLFMYETGIHYIDTLRFLVGEITSVYARLFHFNSNIAGEDGAVVFFEFKNGATATLNANRYNEADTDNPRYTFGEITLEGSKGGIYLDTQSHLSLKKLGLPKKVLDYPREDINFAGDCVYFTQLSATRSLLKNISFETEGSYYLENIKILEAIYKSARENAPIDLTNFRIS